MLSFARTSRWIKLILKWALLAFVLWQIWIVGWILWWKWVPPSMTNMMEIRALQLQVKNPNAPIRQVWIPYEKIADSLKKAVVASEDDRFLDHDGVDWEGMQKAFEKNLKKGKVVRGGSTITQQLAKNLFLSGERSYFRKAKELVIAFWLEALWDKRRILEVYINVAEWGEGLFGAQMASRYYFGVNAGELLPAQSARLAVLLPAPRKYQKNIYSDYLNRRTDTIWARMRYSEIP